MYKSILVQAKQLVGAKVISALCSEAARAKNVLINHNGYSPVQWMSIWGYTRTSWTQRRSRFRSASCCSCSLGRWPKRPSSRGTPLTAFDGLS